MHGLSVVIPCFDAGAFLGDAIASVFALDLQQPVEVIVADDCSSDAATLRQLETLEKTAGVRVLRGSERQGAQHARNRGVAAVQHPFILPLDADDLVARPDGNDRPYPDRAVELLLADDRIAFVHTMSSMFGGAEGFTISAYPLRESLVLAKHHVPTSIVYRREDAVAGTGYDALILKWQDWSFAVGLLADRWRSGRANEIACVDGAHHRYRIHRQYQRLSSATVSEYEMTLLTVQRHFDYFADRYASKESAEELATRVWQSKPSKLVELLYVAQADLTKALEIVAARDCSLNERESGFDIP